jgi:hypothetical protein
MRTHARTHAHTLLEEVKTTIQNGNVYVCDFMNKKLHLQMWKVFVCITNVCYKCTYLISNKMIHTHMTLFCGFELMMTDEVIQGRLGWIESFGWSWSSVIRFFPWWSPSNHQSRGWWICHSSPAHFQKCKSFISFLFFDWQFLLGSSPRRITTK